MLAFMDPQFTYHVSLHEVGTNFKSTILKLIMF